VDIQTNSFYKNSLAIFFEDKDTEETVDIF